jgi:spermidine/putrescine transport system substrate-binding protein
MRSTNRKQFLQRMAAGGSLLAVPGLLAACGGGGIEGEDEGEATSAAAPAAPESSAASSAGGATSEAGASSAADVATSAQAETTAAASTGELADTLRISNWTLYIDIDEETNERPSLKAFEDEYGVKVEYTEDINSNEEFFGKVQAPLSKGQSIDRDLMVLTDYMAARVVGLGYVEKLDKAAIPNAKNLQPALAGPVWDPNREMSMPWQSGFTGLAYDPEKVGKELTSVDDLMDPKLKGKFTLLSEMPDTLGLIMLSLGLDPTTVDDGMFDQALAKLEDMAKNVRQFTGNDYSGMLARGDIWACFGWLGDVAQLQADNPKLKFVVPEAGGIIWTDNMLIPKGGDVYTASVFMDYVYRPKVAAQIEAYVNYISPVVGAEEEMKALDPEVASNPLIFPPQDVLDRVKAFDPNASNNEDYKKRFAEVVGA